MAEKYANPDVLVETDWVAERLQDPNVRIVESDEDYLLYDTGHIPGAVKIDWFTTLQDPLSRDFLSKDAFEKLNSDLGIANDTTVVFYGDKNNWFATYAFWLFEMYGHQKMKIMNGGRAKWTKEGRPLVRDVPQYPRAQYRANDQDPNIRAFRDKVLAQSQPGNP